MRQHPPALDKKGINMSSTNIYQHTCEKCASNYETSSTWGSRRFCSRSCANSRSRPQELRDRIGTTLTGRKSKPESILKGLETKKLRNQLKPKTHCIVCQEELTKSWKKTCSRECWIESKRAYALKQEKHGGGHKGRYKGIPCDSTYELAYLIWNLDHGIDITRACVIYSYSYKGKISSYIPDFVVEGQEVEIKGFMSARAQAKLEQNPQVFVVDKVAIQPFIRYVKQTYRVKDLRDMYDSKDHQITCNHCTRLFTPGHKTQLYCSVSCASSNRHAMKRWARGPRFERG
jgi:hypothetical protein